MWMNEYEIDDAVSRFFRDPVLSPACVTLSNLRDAVNASSDGWPYWRVPSRAAEKLMDLIQTAEREEWRGGQHTVTAAQVRKALSPIKSFRTRHGMNFAVVEPELRYVVRDRAATQYLATFSAINPRYLVMDTLTGEICEELQSKRAADDSVRMLNAG